MGLGDDTIETWRRKRLEKSKDKAVGGRWQVVGPSLNQPGPCLSSCSCPSPVSCQLSGPRAVTPHYFNIPITKDTHSCTGDKVTFRLLLDTSIHNFQSRQVHSSLVRLGQFLVLLVEHYINHIEIIILAKHQIYEKIQFIPTHS